MFWTLVIVLPSKFTGATLRVFSPASPYTSEETFTFGSSGVGASSGTPRSTTRSKARKEVDAMRRVHFAAFYADCFHEVTELTVGSHLSWLKVAPTLCEGTAPWPTPAHLETWRDHTHSRA